MAVGSQGKYYYQRGNARSKNFLTLVISEKNRARAKRASRHGGVLLRDVQRALRSHRVHVDPQQRRAPHRLALRNQGEHHHHRGQRGLREA